MTLRRIIATHRAGVALLLAATLLLRLLVPAGFMPQISASGVRLVLCSGSVPAWSAPPMAHAAASSAPSMAHAAMPGMTHHDGGHDPAPTHPEMPCAFAGLGLALLGAVDPVLLAVALAFAMLLAVRASAPPPVRRAARLRPPLRAPPRFA